jgi:hypothetical protein
MSHHYSRISEEVTEVDRNVNVNGAVLNEPDIGRLVLDNRMPLQPPQQPLLAQQAVNHAPVVQRPIPDQPYVPGKRKSPCNDLSYLAETLF